MMSGLSFATQRAEETLGPPTHAPPRGRSNRALVGFVVVAVVVAVVNTWMLPGEMIQGDPLAWHEEARSLLHTGHLRVDADVAKTFGEPGQYFVQNGRTGHWYSKYGVMNALMAIPPTWIEEAWTGNRLKPGQKPHLLVLGLYNVAIAVLLATVLFALTGLFTDRLSLRVGYVLAAFYATFFFYHHRSQGCELHCTLFFACHVATMSRFRRGLAERNARWPSCFAWLVAAWLFVAALVFSRIVFALLLPITACAAFVAMWQTTTPATRRRALRLFILPVLLPPLLIALAVAAVNHIKFGSPFLTGYHQWNPDWHMPTQPAFVGVWGFLFSPRLSVFLCFPLLAMAIPAIPHALRRQPVDYGLVVAAFVVFVVVIGKTRNWPGEWTYGPRYLCFVLPVAALPAIEMARRTIDAVKRPGYALVAIAATWALCHSTVLHFQANRLPFFIWYYACAPLDVKPVGEAQQYFWERPQAVLISELLDKRGRLHEMGYYPALEKHFTGAVLSDYIGMLESQMRQGNSYWKNRSAHTCK